ncbi:unknown [Clostridium sp. CAG:354]|mgnify:FL=1|nr:unknown [Clostridium sp. CAG:354]
MYLYVNPINRSYEIANSEQTINKLKELSSKINEYINESEESEEDEL